VVDEVAADLGLARLEESDGALIATTPMTKMATNSGT